MLENRKCLNIKMSEKGTGVNSGRITSGIQTEITPEELAPEKWKIINTEYFHSETLLNSPVGPFIL